MVNVADESPGAVALTAIVPGRFVACTSDMQSPLKAARCIALSGS
jgi:hypothetical protein